MKSKALAIIVSVVALFVGLKPTPKVCYQKSGVITDIDPDGWVDTVVLLDDGSVVEWHGILNNSYDGEHVYVQYAENGRIVSLVDTNRE